MSAEQTVQTTPATETGATAAPEVSEPPAATPAEEECAAETGEKKGACCGGH